MLAPIPFVGVWQYPGVYSYTMWALTPWGEFQGGCVSCVSLFRISSSGQLEGIRHTQSLKFVFVTNSKLPETLGLEDILRWAMELVN